MNAYVDASVLLRLLFGQANQLASWNQIVQGVSSELVRVECLRTIDRAALRAALTSEDVSMLRATALDLFSRLSLAPITSSILNRASEPFPTTLGTLDAIHLATALELGPEWPDLVIATHDEELALAARSVGFVVSGVQRAGRV
jgi:predicted nucleic acid-binding protein